MPHPLSPTLVSRRSADRSHPHRRTLNLSRLADRPSVSPPPQSDHMRGWVCFGLSLPLPADASLEMRAGYAEARNQAIDILTAQEHAA